MRFQLVRETDGIVHWDLPFERVGQISVRDDIDDISLLNDLCKTSPWSDDEDSDQPHEMFTFSSRKGGAR